MTSSTDNLQPPTDQPMPALASPKHYTWTAIYQIGGWANFSWRKCLPVSTYAAGADLRDELQRMGYPSDLYRTDILDEVGMPTEYRALEN